MLGDIDYDLKPIQPQYFIAKPNREIIGKLSEAYSDSIDTKLNDVDELNLTVPFYRDIRHKLVRNKNIELLKERYLIKVVRKNKIDWFIINEVSEQADDDRQYKQVKCYSLSHELTDKIITAYTVDSYHAGQVIKDLLSNTIWSVDYIDADFLLTYRAFDFNSTNALDALFSVAETYNAIVHFNTDKRQISLTKPELTGINKGLTFSWGKYLKSVGRTSQTDQMVTRLYATGSDGMGIQKVNPTGQNYIENFGYFKYPFQRDANKNTLSSSYYMSDSLCHALTDYEELVESKQGLFKSYLEELERYETEMNQLEVDLNKLKNNEAVITDTMLAQQFDDKMFFEKYIHTGNSSRSFTLNNTYAYAVLIKVDNMNGASVSLDGSSKYVPTGQWTLLGKVKDVGSCFVSVNGGNTSVFIQVCNISLTEFNDSSNEKAIIERYSLDNKQNQINLKEIEIQNKNNQIDDVKKRISQLQTSLLAENNFTPAQLQELNLFVIEREFKDENYIYEQDLYDAALEKFKELQKPALNIVIDIVNFLEIVEEQRNWDKLVLGDFVNIKYEPTNTYVEARITQINYDFDGKSISLTLSNAKDINDESKRIEKFLNDAKNTSVIVDTNKNKWGQAVVDTSEMSKLFENFWNKVTNDINMASNEYVTIDRKGITIIDPNDHLRFLRATHGVLGLTRSGGLKYETAISPDGVIAEMVLGKIILGQRVVIGDTIGVFTIEGSRLMIDDRCGREVVKLGLLSENPDKFGLYLNRYVTSNCSDKTVVNKVKMTADEGFIIERIRNGIAEKTFGTTLDGDLFVKAGVDDQVFTIDKNGLALGSSVWQLAPFHADYFGNVWMNKLFADSAEIKNSLFKDGHIRGSDLELRSPKGIIKMYPEYGLWFGAENFDDAPASISMDGTAKFKKLLVTDGNNTLLIDSEKKKFYANEWDMVGLGAIDAELIAANMLSVQDGIISNLTAGRLSTLTNAALNDWSNYIRIEGNSIKYITGKVKPGSGVQKTLPDGRPLYWVSDKQTGLMTVEPTAWPVLVYEMDEKVKQEITFEGSGDQAEPKRIIGLGDGTPNGSKAVESKYKGGYKISYGASNTGKDRSVDLADDGIIVNSEGGKTMISTKDFTVTSDNGIVKIGNTQGCLIEMNGKTMTFKAGDFQFQNI